MVSLKHFILSSRTHLYICKLVLSIDNSKVVEGKKVIGICSWDQELYTWEGVKGKDGEGDL